MLKKFLKASKFNLSNLDNRTVKYLSNMYMQHRFDLLGSGWVENSYFAKIRGIHGKKFEQKHNIEKIDIKGEWLKKIIPDFFVEKSKKYWQQIVNPYNPIDWQLDFKSGYRWNAKLKSEKAVEVIGKIEGADIKLPWELSRMYHLLQLAFFSLLTTDKNKYIIEFKNQVLDFVSANPIGYGVNWACTMEVAIRAVNFLLSYDIFREIDRDNILDEEFNEIFYKTIKEHESFIINNLEWSDYCTTNHYLANICGLIFIACYIGNTKLLDFAYKEFLSELDKQFYNDGGNFEDSTYYHRLSCEMLTLSFAVLSRFKKLPEKYIKKIFKMGEFLSILIKDDYTLPQFGDNDSGRFVKLTPCGNFRYVEEMKKYLNLKEFFKVYNYRPNEEYWIEDVLNCAVTIAYFSGLYFKEFDFYGKLHSLEKQVAEQLFHSKKIIINKEKRFFKFNKEKSFEIDKNKFYKKKIYF